MTARPQPVTQDAPAPLRLVTGGDRLRLRRAVLWVLYTILSVSVFLLFIYLRTEVDNTVYRNRQLQSQIEREQVLVHELNLLKLQLESPEQVLPIAENVLGMVHPEELIPIAITGQQDQPVSQSVSAGSPPRLAGVVGP